MTQRLHAHARAPRGSRVVRGQKRNADTKGPKSTKRPKSAKGPRSPRTPVGRSLLGLGGRLGGAAKVGQGRSSKTSPKSTAKGSSKAGVLRSKRQPTTSVKKDRRNTKPPSVAVRRNRVPVALAAVVALVILGTSFPLSALISQHGQLSVTSGQLQTLKNQNDLLAEQQRQLNSTTDVDRLARQDYQMVMPGQMLYDVLPPSGLAAATTGGATPGDPGSQPLVSPANAPDMTPDPNLPSASASPGGSTTSGVPGAGGHAGQASGSAGGAPQQGQSASGGSEPTSAPSSFWSRVTSTLEFWK